MTTDQRRRELLAEAVANAERATDMADRYATAVTEISQALAEGTPASVLKARLTIAALDTAIKVTAGAR